MMLLDVFVFGVVGRGYSWWSCRESEVRTVEVRVEDLKGGDQVTDGHEAVRWVVEDVVAGPGRVEVAYRLPDSTTKTLIYAPGGMAIAAGRRAL